MKKLLGLLLLLTPALAAGQDAPFPISPVFSGSGRPLPGAQISICANPAAGSPCTNFASTFSDQARTLPINQAINPIVTDSFGNVPAVFAAPGIYTFSISGAGIGTLGPYFVTISCTPGVSCVASSANNAFTGTNSFININDILWVGPPAGYTNIATAVAAAGSNPTIIAIRSTYEGTECVIPPSTVYFWDFRNLSGSPCGANTDSYNGLTAGGVQSFLRHSWVLTTPSTSRSYELTTNLASYQGSLPGSGNSLEGITSVAVIIGTPTFPGSTLNLVGIEAHAFTQSLLGLLPNAFGLVTSAGQQSGTTNITTAAGLFVQTNPNAGGTIANNYGIFMQVQSGGTARNFSFFSQGAGLFSSDAGGSGINFEDSALVTHPVLTALSATNQMRFRPLLDTAGFCFDNAASSADWLCAKSTGVSIPTVGLSIGGGSNLTTSNQTGTGSIVLANAPTITSPTIASGINGDGSGLKAKRGAAGCATAAPAGSACTTTVTWTTPFADANYTAMCGGRGITSGVPVYGGITAQLAASVTFQTVSGTAAAAQFTNIDCTAVHD